MGPLTVITGANASGKSNVLDALRFIHGIGRGYTLAEIVGGNTSSELHSHWLPIRGGVHEISQFGYNRFGIAVSMNIEGYSVLFSISIRVNEIGRFSILRESLEFSKGSNPDRFSYHVDYGDDYGYTDLEKSVFVPPSIRGRIFARVSYSGSPSSKYDYFDCREDQPVLTQIHRSFIPETEDRDLGRQFLIGVRDVIDCFSKMRFLDLVPDRLREPGFPGRTILGDQGENLPTALQEVCSDLDRKSELTDWIHELTPMDVADFDFLSDPNGRVHLVIKERLGQTVSASSASDGTLKFLAILVALMGTTSGYTYIFEEIESGLHPTRVQLLLDFIQRKSSDIDIQLVTTTHSTELISMIDDVTFRNTSVVARLPHRTDSIIRSAISLPKVWDLRESQGLEQLFRSGWMEDVLEFSQNFKNSTD